MSWFIQRGLNVSSFRTGLTRSRSWKVFGGAVLIEHHSKPCTCSYCMVPVNSVYGTMGRVPEPRMIGYTASINKSPTSWYYLHLKSNKGTWYIRWTKSKLGLDS